VRCTNADCQGKVPDSERICPSCGSDNGYPNVRIAHSAPEAAELQGRLTIALAQAKATGCESVLARFMATIRSSSKAVICRDLSVVSDLFDNPHRMYTTYHYQLASQARMPEDNTFDITRTQFESALFPNYYREIRFAALTLSNRGASSFGNCAMFLRESLIAHRTSVFEENPADFARRHGILLTDRIPPGYRATWIDRDQLAAAKLGSKISANTLDHEFADVLLNEDVAGTTDFIEVHVFGPITATSVETVVAARPISKADRVIWRRLERTVKAAGSQAVLV
jgi:hypothetical protein